MSEIEADADIVEVRAGMSSTRRSGVESSLGMFSSRMRTPSGLANARRCSMEVMAASNFFSSKLSLGLQVLHQKAKRNLLGNFERALDLVHGVDAAGAVGGGDVEGGAPARPHS